MVEPPDAAAPGSPSPPRRFGASTADAIMLALGLLVVLISFLSWYRVRFIIAKPPFVRSYTAWRSGLFAWAAVLIALGTASFAGARIAGAQLKMRMTVPAFYLLSGVAVFFLTALRALVRPANLSGLGNNPDVVEVTRGFGLYLALLASAGMAYAGFRAYVEERRGS